MPLKQNTRENTTSPPIRAIRLGLRGLISLYQVTFSALAGRQCRYLPTCSEYASTAIDRYGVWRGMWMALARIARCGPRGASGYDPVPENRPTQHWYLPWRNGQWSGDHLKDSETSKTSECGDP